jgi:HEAT repeat protein
MNVQQTAVKVWAVVVLLCLYGCAAGRGGAQPQTSQVAAAEQGELSTLWDMLNAPDSPPKTRYQAATLLLTKTQPRAAQILLEALADRIRRPAGVAVAQAITESGRCGTAFVAPLLAMLADADPAVRVAAATALSQSADPAVRRQLCDVAGDTSLSDGPRLACIAALGRIVDSQCIDRLVWLLDDPHAPLRAAAAESLSRLTGIRRFGADAPAWNAWWKENQNKPKDQWLADLAEGLCQQNSALAVELLAARRRLADAMRTNYDATPAPKRGEMELAMLQDPLPEVRLLGLELSTRQVSAREPLLAGSTEAVRTLLDDAEPAVRAAAAMLMAAMQTPGADAVLLARLKIETASEVRIALIKSLAAMRVVEAFDVIVAELAGPNEGQASAAAAAIARFSEAGGLSDGQIARAAGAIAARYAQAQDSEMLRTALLSVMRVLRRQEFAATIRAALADKAPAVRLEAVRALAVIRAASADDVAPLTQDSDRGVRQAAMDTLAALGDARVIGVVMDRTMAVETDPAVRQKAWETVVALLEKAPTDQVAAAARQLAERPEAREYRIRVLNMLMERQKDDSIGQANVQAELGEVLLAADQPARAAEVLAEAYANAPTSRRDRLWLLWIDALLGADDPAALKAIAEQRDEDLFPAAVERLCQRLEVLRAAERYSTAVTLADLALSRLGDRLEASSRQAIAAWRMDCDRRSRQSDAARVAGLLKALNGADAAAAEQARRELVTMGRRAAVPMLEQLRTCMADETVRGQMERTVPALLGVIDGRFTGYDPAAPLDDRQRVVEGWLQKAQP